METGGRGREGGKREGRWKRDERGKREGKGRREGTQTNDTPSTPPLSASLSLSPRRPTLPFQPRSSALCITQTYPHETTRGLPARLSNLKDINVDSMFSYYRQQSIASVCKKDEDRLNWSLLNCIFSRVFGEAFSRLIDPPIVRFCLI